MFIRHLMAPDDGTTGAAPPAAAPPAAEPKVTPPAKAAAPAASDPDDLPSPGEPGWVKARVERAKEVGKKEAKRDLKEQRKALKSAADEAKTLKTSADASLAAAKLTVDTLLADIPEEERAVIVKTGAGDVTKTLESFAVWKSAKGIKLGVAPAAAAVPTAPAAVSPPATTAPATTAPAPAAPGTPPPIRQQYEQIRQIQDPAKRALSLALLCLENDSALLSNS